MASHHTLTYVSAGTYGCVVRNTLACDAAKPPLLPRAPTFSGTTVSKLSLGTYTQNVGAIVNVLNTVDPDHSFTVPIETMCNVTAAERARIVADGQCLSLAADIGAAGDAPDVSQITMRAGETYHTYLRRESVRGTPLHVLYAQLHELFVGIRRMHTFEIGHGDLKESNMLYFASDNKIRLIDFDLMFRYDLDPALQVRSLDEPHYSNFWSDELSSSEAEEIFEDAESDEMAVFNYNGDAYYFPPDDILICKRKLQEGYWDAKLNRFADAPDGLDVYKQLETFGCLRATWAGKLEELRVYIAALDLDTYGGFDMLANYDPEKFTVFQLGNVLIRAYSQLSRRFDSLPASLRMRMRDLVTYMLMPMAKDRINFDDTLRLLDEWIWDVLALEMPAAPRRAPAPAQPIFVLQIKFDAESIAEGACAKFLAQLYTRHDLCRNGADYFTETNMRSTPTGALWMLHDDSAVAESNKYPDVRRIVALALVSNSAAVRYERFIHYICATKRAPKYAGSTLFNIIASNAAFKSYQTLALHAANKDLVKTYESGRYGGMTCDQTLTCRLALVAARKLDVPSSKSVSVQALLSATAALPAAAAAARRSPPKVAAAAETAAETPTRRNDRKHARSDSYASSYGSTTEDETPP